jgi:sarcosine oxidase subunit delta
MRIACPYCGERELGEFTYFGDASKGRPHGGDDEGYYDYVYIRDNIAGEMPEYWYHGGGCRTWLIVVRNTLNHEIRSVEAAPGAGAKQSGGRRG